MFVLTIIMLFMKFHILFLVFYSLQITAQKSNEYLGGVKLNDTTIIPYKINFTENNGTITGYSLTDFGGEHETKSTIIGSYNDAENLLSFREVKIIYTKSPVSQNDFCHINFEPTRFRLGKTKHFKGSFKGKFSDGSECINGEIYLNSKENIEKNMAIVSKKVNKSKKVDTEVKEKLNNLKVMDSVNLNILRKGEITSVFTKSNQIKLSFYDGAELDDDVITVKINGKIIIYKHLITNQEKVLEIDLDAKKTEITISSVSVGNIGETTVTLELSDGTNKIKAITNLKKEESTMVHVLKE